MEEVVSTAWCGSEAVALASSSGTVVVLRRADFSLKTVFQLYSTVKGMRFCNHFLVVVSSFGVFIVQLTSNFLLVQDPLLVSVSSPDDVIDALLLDGVAVVTLDRAGSVKCRALEGQRMAIFKVIC